MIANSRKRQKKCNFKLRTVKHYMDKLGLLLFLFFFPLDNVAHATKLVLLVK